MRLNSFWFRLPRFSLVRDVFEPRSSRRRHGGRRGRGSPARVPERLEERRLLAFDLVAAYVRPGEPFFINNGTSTADVLTTSPQEITLRFSPGTVIDPASLQAGITVTRSGRGGDAFGSGGTFADVTVPIGSLTVNDIPNQNEVVVRFAETLPDDSYRIAIKGDTNLTNATIDGLKSLPPAPIALDSFRDGGTFSFDYRVELGAHVVSVVPQPVIRAKTIDFKALPTDGDLLTVAIRGGRRTFEFDSGNGVQPGNTSISLTSATVNSLASAVATAINGLSTTAGFAGEIGSATASGAVVTLTGTSFTPVVSATRSGGALAANVITIGDGALTHLRDRVVVHFNGNDPLNTASAQNPANYQLFETHATTAAALSVVTPTGVSYDATSATAVLSFAAGAVADDRLYRLQVGNAADANNTVATAIDIGSIFARPVGAAAYTTTARLGDGSSGANDVDLYKFRVTAGGTISFVATPQAGLDVALRLFASNGSPITSGNGFAVSANGPGAANTLSYSPTTAGDFFIGVSSVGNAAYSAVDGTGATGATGGLGSYTVAVTSTVPVPASDENSSYSTASGLGTLGVGGSLIAASIENRPTVATPAGDLPFPNSPGSLDSVGHREIPVDGGLEQHGMPGVGGAGAAGPIPTRYFNFASVYGADPQGNTLFNAITETQKQRAREIFDLYSRLTGIRFVESDNLGIQIVTGDMRALEPTITTGPGGLASLGGNQAIMNSTIDWGDSEYGGSWFQVAMHEIGHNLGLIHSYDLPSIMGAGESPTDGLLPTEPVFPGNYDIEHALQIVPKSGTDIDIYSFQVDAPGRFTAETIVARPGQPLLVGPNGTSYLDTVLTLYREVTVNGVTTREMVARNDDYFGRDSFVGLDLERADTLGNRYTYYVAVTSTGNTNFDPAIANSGAGGRSQGDYQLQMNFVPVTASNATTTILDSAGTKFDGDRDGVTGGAFDFWFNTAATAKTVYVDKAAAAGGNGSLATPFHEIDLAIASITAANNATPGSRTLLRIVGNDGNAATLADDRPYLIGRTQGQSGTALADGATFNVPAGVTAVIDEGAVLKLRGAVIDVGSSSLTPTSSRAGAALQVLGTPARQVRFTSYHDDTVGGDSDGVGPVATGGQWGGIVLRQDSDVASKRSFVNTVTNAQMQFGGGQVVVDSQLKTFTPIQIESSRPTIAFNTITQSAGAAISADPNAFDDSNGRIGPELRGNLLTNNSINGVFIRIETNAGEALTRLTVPARFKSTDIVYVVAENLVIDGGAGGYVRVAGQDRARDTGRLTIDPGVVVKLVGSRIELGRGLSRLYAEGLPGSRVIFTSLADGRFGAGGTFNTNGNQPDNPAAGDWAGIVLNAGAAASIDQAYVGFGGGTSPIEGRIASFNVFEAHQADLRLANSRIENNATGFSSADGIRTGRGTHAPATIFVRGSQPTILHNDFRDNRGTLISINANALDDRLQGDAGRSTGAIDRFSRFDDNFGALVRDNRISYTIDAAAGRPAGGAITGMEVRGEELTVEGVWDDTDIVHVLTSQIQVRNFHTATGLRLLSQSNASLVVKSLGANASLVASGVPLDIDDRIGGTVQVLGQPGYPVVMTSLRDDSVYASLDPLGRPNRDTNTDGTASSAAAGDWRGLQFLELSNDRNVSVVREAELAYTSAIDVNPAVDSAQVLGTLAPNFAALNAQNTMNSWESAQEKSGDENRRLGFEVHGAIAFDDPTDVDVYGFTGYAGSEVWIDIDKSSPGLDSMIELIDANGNVLARSADSLNDIGVVTAANPEVRQEISGSAVVAGTERAINGVAAASTGVSAVVVSETENVAGVAAASAGVAALVSGQTENVTGVAAAAGGVAATVVGQTEAVAGLGALVAGTSTAITGVATTVPTAVTNSFTVTVADGSVVQNGAAVSGTGVPNGTTVLGAPSGNTVTLSNQVTVTAGTVLTFSQTGQPTNGTTVAVADTSQVRIGAAVTGTGVPNGTTVQNLVGSVVTLSQAIATTQGATLDFGWSGNQLRIGEAIASVGATLSVNGVSTGLTVTGTGGSGTQLTLSGNLATPVAANAVVGFTFVGAGAVSTTRIRVADRTGIAVGALVNGVAGVPAGTRVASIANDSAGNGGTIAFDQIVSVANGNTLGFGSNTTTVTIDTAGFGSLAAGVAITRNGAATGRTVQSVVGSTVTVSGGTLDVANGDFLGFANATALATNRFRIDASVVPSVGAGVSVNGVASGFTVAGFDATSQTVTLNGVNTVSVDNNDLVGFTFVGAGTLSTTRVRVADTTGIGNNVLVNGAAGVPAGTRVQSVVTDANGGTVTFTQAVSVANGNTLGFGSNTTTVTIDTAGFGSLAAGVAISRNGLDTGRTVASVSGSTVTVSGGTLDVANGDFLGFANATAVTANRFRIDASVVPSVGAGVSVNGVASGFTVAGFDATSQTVTLNGVNTVSVDDNDLVGFTFVGAGALSTTRIRVADTTGISTNVLVNGVAGVPAGTRVQSVVTDASGGTVTFNQAVSVASGNTLGFGSNGTAVTIDTAGFNGLLAGVAITRNGAATGRTVQSVVGSTVNVSGGTLDVVNGDFLGFDFVGAAAVLSNRLRIDSSVIPSVGAQVSINGVSSGFTVAGFDTASRTVTLNGGNTVSIDTDDLLGFSFVGGGTLSTTRIRVADTAGISTNVLVSGVAGVPAGTRVQNVAADASGTGGTVTLTQAVTVANSDTLGFGFNGTSVTVVNSAGIQTGFRIGGPGVPAGTTVQSVVGNVLTLSQTVDVADGASLFLGTRSFQLAPASVPPGTLQGIIPGTLAGVVYRDNTAIQTFTVDRAGVFTFTRIGDPVSEALGGVGAVGTVASLDRTTGLVTLPFDVVPTGTIRIEVGYEFSRLPLSTLGFNAVGGQGGASVVKDAWRGNDHYSTNPRDAGMRVILPGTAGNENQYFIRVRSQPSYTAATTTSSYATTLESGSFDQPGNAAEGATSGRYELRVRLRQQDEKPGSTVRYADIRYPVTGIEVIGLPRSSPLVGENGENTTDTNGSFGAAQQLGNLLQTDRNTISVAGQLSNAGDIDWYTFTLDYDLIQSIAGVSGGAKTWATLFDIDYADGFRGDLTLSVFDASGRLLYIGRDSDIADDQPASGQGNDFDDLSRGSNGKLDPFIGSVQMPAGGPGSTTRYYVAISSNEQLPTALNATFAASSLNPRIRLEPVSSVRRIVQDRIDATGYIGESPAMVAATQVVRAASGSVIDPSTSLTLSAHVRPFTLADVTLFVSTSSSLFTVDASRGDAIGNAWETVIANGSYGGGAVGDIDMRTDGRLFQYFGANGDGSNNGLLREMDTATGAILSTVGDGISDDPSPATFWQITGQAVDAVAIGRRGVGDYTDQVFYSVRDTGGSYLYSSRGAGTVDFDGTAPDTYRLQLTGTTPTNTGRTGFVTGLQHRNENGTLYAITSTGQFFAALGNGVLADFSGVLTGAETFQGLATGPVNLENGRFAGTFFAITSSGRLVCIDPATNSLVANVFDTNNDGYADSHISNPTVSGATGLAFSPLDINLWHPTTRRGDLAGDPVSASDEGHGVNATRDNMRAAEVGGMSMYFGLEDFDTRSGGYSSYGGGGQYGTTNYGSYNWQQELTSPGGSAIGNNYNLPGGAYGSLITNPFSLAGYTYTDKPTLYFNYFLDSQNASGRLDSGNTMRDSARVFVSTDDGLSWTLLATNNQARSDNDGDAPEAELPAALSVSSAIGTANNQHVQELFDTTDWRQARVDLGTFVGRSNLRLRFDFSTAGEFDPGDRSRITPDTIQTVAAGGATAGSPIVTLGSVEGLRVGMIVRSPLDVSARDSVGAPVTQRIPTGATMTTITAINPSTNQITLSQNVGVATGMSNSQLQFFRGTPELLNDINGPAADTGDFRFSTASSQRGASNAFEGFYIDDIIVGFAERGEMVTGALPDQTAFFGIGTPIMNEYNAQVLQGPYQLEIRRGTEYGDQPAPLFAQTGVTQLFDTNARLVRSPADTVLTLEENTLSAVGGAVTTRGSGVVAANSNGLRMSGNGGTSTQHNAVFWSIDLANQPSAFLEFEYRTGLNTTTSVAEQLTPLPSTFTLASLAGGTAGNQLPTGDGVAVSTDGGLTWTTIANFTATANAFRTTRLRLTPGITPTATTVIGFFQSGSLTAAQGGGITVRNAEITTAPRVATSGLVGDRNLIREQGQFIIESNLISDASQFGIRIDAAARASGTNAPRPGVPASLPTLNNQRLVPGAVVTNNVISSSGTAGILFSGQTNAAGLPPAAVPFGRIVNNTFYGGGSGVGVQVTDNASPTLINNLFADLATGVSVDAGSATAGTIVAYSAFWNTTTQVSGAPQSDQLDLTADPFVNAAGGNYYLAPGSAAIDSSLDTLQDRNQFVVLKNAVGIPPSPLLAPSLDLYGQLRLDDPSVAGGAPGLGLNVFKDRGAIERADFVQPTAALVTPLDNSTDDRLPAANVIRLERETARGLTELVLQLADNGIGIDDSTVTTAAFTVQFRPLVGAGTFSNLVDGSGYVFQYLENTKTAVFQSPSVFALGEYRIVVDNTSTTGIRDLAGNRLLNNDVGGTGTTAFTVALVDVPGVPTGVQGTVLPTSVALQWVAPAAPTGATLAGFFVEHSSDGGTTWSRSAQLAANATNHTVTSLTNGTTYLFRVAAVNDSGIAPTAPETVVGLGQFSTPISVTPLATPTLTLASDTGTSNSDLVTSSGLVNVGGLQAGGSWEVSINGGAPTAGTGSTFTLPAGTYAPNSIQVRQTFPVGNTSQIGSNAQQIVIDQTVPLAPTLLLDPNVSPPVSAIEAAQPVTVQGEVGAQIVVTFVRGATTITKTLTGNGSAQPVVLSSAEVGQLGDGIVTVTATQTDLAGNAQTVAAASLQFTLDTTPPSGAATLSLGQGIVGDVSAAEATQAGGVVVVSGDAGNLVVVVFTRGANSVQKTVNATGASQPVALTAADLLTLGNGSVNVTATQTDPAGNPQTQPVQSLSFILDGTAPTPVVLALEPSIVPPVSRTEALQPAGVVTVTGENGATITVTFTRGAAVVTKSLTGTGASQAVTLTAGDLTTLGDGSVTVDASQTDGAGNVQSADTTEVTFLLDATAPQIAPTLAHGAGAANGATLAEATQSGGIVTVTGESGATIVVTFVRGATTITKTLTGTGSAQPVVLSSAEVGQLGDGVVAVSATQTDAAGNVQSVPASQLNVTIDTVLPTLAITSSTQTLRAGQAALITFTLSEPSTTFTSGSVAVTGGSLSPITGTGAVYTATFTPTAGSTTPGLVSVAAGTFTDVAGNANATGAQSPSIAIDTVLPTIAIATSAQSLRIGQTAILTFTLSEIATDFVVGDVTVTGGALSDFAGSGTAYTATFTPFATSTVPGNVSVATGAFSDAFGNPNVAGSLALPIDIDTVAPAVSIAASPTALRAGQSAVITFTLSEASTTFSAGDVVATGGTLTNFAGSGATYSAVFTPADGSTAPGTISVAAGAFTDAFGNPSVAGALSPALAIDTVLPTIAITSSVASLRGGQSATITFTLSESSSDFGIGDVSVAGGTLSSFAGSGANYTATFTPAANSTAPGAISVAAGAFTDAFGNPNLAGSLAQPIAIDTVAPVFLTIVSSAASLATGQTATISFTLSEPSATFGIDDLVATGGTLSNFTGSGTTYSVTFTPSPDSTAPGTVVIPPGGFTDLAGNPNPAAALAQPIVIDTVAPVVSGFSTTSPNRSYAIGDSIAILATLSEAVQPGGTLDVVLNSGAVVTLTATGGTTLSGTYVIQPGNAAAALDVVGISPTGSLRDLAGNALTSTALPPAAESLAGRHAIVVDGAVKVLPVAGFSTDPALVPAVRQPVGRVAVTFTTPVTGVTVDSFRLFLNGRSVSLRGSRITGSGQNYTLILPARRTTPRGIYTLEVVGSAGIRAVGNGAAMTLSSLFYWGRSQSVGISRNAMLSAFASLR